MAFEKEHGNRTVQEMKERLGRFKPHVMEAWQMPLQQNEYDCGIFVCQYIQALVEACFEGAEHGVRFSMSPLAYRRVIREDVCALAEGRLIGELIAAGHEIPPGNEIRKPPEFEVIGDEVEDREWRAEMAERMHRLEVRNESQAVAIAKLERQLRELMQSRTPQPGIGGVDIGEGHGDVGGDVAGEGHVDVGQVATGQGHGDAGGDAVGEGHGDVGGNNAGTHDSMRGAHGEGLEADVEAGVGGINNLGCRKSICRSRPHLPTVPLQLNDGGVERGGEAVLGGTDDARGCKDSGGQAVGRVEELARSARQPP
ncbi:unnamed protein product [Closterium sp. NIES-65]|nr:unnamed protein product [Closterium sp. NIES-65]